MNSGKKFEQNFKKSTPDGVFYYRLRDGSSSWDKSSKTRFQQTNICDCILFDGNYLYTLELKSTKGKSLPYTNIKKHQINDLLWCDKYANVISGFVIEFDSLNECYFVEINDFKTFYDNNDRKSLPVDFCREKGIKISIKNMKTNRKFNVEKFLADAIKLG